MLFKTSQFAARLYVSLATSGSKPVLSCFRAPCSLPSRSAVPIEESSAAKGRAGLHPLSTRQAGRGIHVLSQQWELSPKRQHGAANTDAAAAIHPCGRAQGRVAAAAKGAGARSRTCSSCSQHILPQQRDLRGQRNGTHAIVTAQSYGGLFRACKCMTSKDCLCFPQYREEEGPAVATVTNIMFDKRVVRGNTYAARILPAEAGMTDSKRSTTSA